MEKKKKSLSPNPFQCQLLGQLTAFNQHVTEIVTERYFAQHVSEHQAHVAITTVLLSHRAPGRAPLTPGSYPHPGQLCLCRAAGHTEHSGICKDALPSLSPFHSLLEERQPGLYQAGASLLSDTATSLRSRHPGLNTSCKGASSHSAQSCFPHMQHSSPWNAETLRQHRWVHSTCS